MANPTTNYGFVLPTPTDLVTDLPADFDVALQGVDTRLKALQPGTTLGDLAYSSATANTNTRLGIGSTGDVLTVTGGVPTWAAPAPSGSNWTLLNAGGTALTGATTITVSGISNADKVAVFVTSASSANASAEFTIRLNADSGNNYYSIFSNIIVGATYAVTNFRGSNSWGTNQIYLARMYNNAGGTASYGITFTGCNSSGKKLYSAIGGGNENASYNGQELFNSTGYYDSASTISSITVLSSTGNLDAGTVYVYTSA